MVNIERIKSISSGDSANVFGFKMENHWGTHIDAPNHFFAGGMSISEYPAEWFYFRSPQTINIELDPSEIFTVGDWVGHIKRGADILLFRSGWGGRRDTQEYVLQNPGIHPDVGLYLREKHPSIRAVGIDWISISSYTNRALGREAHRAFLDPEKPGNPISIIEDMRIPDNAGSLKELWALPLLIEDMDSAPCTVAGVFF